MRADGPFLLISGFQGNGMSKKEVHILIVEDNHLIAEDLAAYMLEFGYSVAGIASNADEAMKLLRSQQVDLMLMDVGLEGEIDGIQLALLVREKYNLPLVFLTAFHDQGTIERIKSTRPEAYLVKPVDEFSLKTTLEVALYNFSQKNMDSGLSEVESFGQEEYIFIKVKQGLIKVQFSDVLFFEAYDNYAFVYTAEQRHLLNLSLKVVETRIPARKFMRVHRSFIVNTDKIERIDEIYLYIGKHVIPIGKTFRSDIMSRIRLL